MVLRAPQLRAGGRAAWELGAAECASQSVPDLPALSPSPFALESSLVTLLFATPAASSTALPRSPRRRFLLRVLALRSSCSHSCSCSPVPARLLHSSSSSCSYLAARGSAMLDDDVWGSDSEGEGGRHLSAELDHEWQARQSQFHTLGYRDGVEAGKNSSVQEGFNLGYAEATVAGFNWGVARGLTRAFAALPTSVTEKLVGEGEARGRLEALKSSIHSYSSTDALRSFHRDLNKTLEVGVSGSDAAQEVRTFGLGSQRGGPLNSRDETGVVSWAGLDRLPESHSVGMWEADYRGETGQMTVLGRNTVVADCSAVEAGSGQEHVQQPGESSGEEHIALVSSEGERDPEVTPVGSLIASRESGNYEDDKSSSFMSSAAGKSELEELEKKVRNEFEVASIKICDVLVGV